MTPPEAPKDGTKASQGNGPPAVSLRLEVMRKRADFLRTSRARHTATPGFVLQMRWREDSSPITRVGFTCSKKVGNAVARNRAKRRLREVARLVLPAHGQPGTDYVLIGRKERTATLPFDQLQTDLIRALDRLQNGTE